MNSLDLVHPGPDVFDPQPLDFDLAVPEIDYLLSPYVPRGFRIWAWGPTESGKSIWALDIAASLSRDGHRVVYLSQENPRAVEVSRLQRLSSDSVNLRLFHDQGFDLALTDHADKLLELADQASLVVIDTLSQCWSGDENSNEEIVAFDRTVLSPLIRMDSSVLVIHHTGHGSKGYGRRGATAGRGASSMGQKADLILTIERGATTSPVLKITNDKNRATGGAKIPPAYFEVRDEADGQLAIVPWESAPPQQQTRAQTAREAVLASLQGAEPKQRSEIVHAVEAATGIGSSTIQAAFKKLVSEGSLAETTRGSFRLVE